MVMVLACLGNVAKIYAPGKTGPRLEEEGMSLTM